MPSRGLAGLEGRIWDQKFILVAKARHGQRGGGDMAGLSEFEVFAPQTEVNVPRPDAMMMRWPSDNGAILIRIKSLIP